MNKKFENWKTVALVAVGIMAIILLSLSCVQGAQNSAYSLEEQVNTAMADINVQEKRRVDLVYNLADCVMQYDKHEAETLTSIVRGRDTGRDIGNVTTAIIAVSEAYPELKSNENYKELMNELSITENLIAEYRSNYNKQVKEYNRFIRKFPTRWFLNILGYDAVEFKYLDYSAPVDAPQNLFED
ncbi:LemA family protein [Bacteroides acidifaciens]|uniref:LemA family protein n=1 Tax=Bacteroides acidifaciens TaxID=85831 RepID=UPI00248C8981|nr:LemA family protein [Bacteroides acidifaciens]